MKKMVKLLSVALIVLVAMAACSEHEFEGPDDDLFEQDEVEIDEDDRPHGAISFTYNGTAYDIIKKNRTWEDAADYAEDYDGYLAEINSQGEQDAIYNALLGASIDVTKTIAPDGGGASYVWIGGNDIKDEGVWIWDGENEGEEPQFWQGIYDGYPVGGLYNNWGDEPDNWGEGSGQDGLGLALTDWYYGIAGQWNDVKHTNKLYFVVEY